MKDKITIADSPKAAKITAKLNLNSMQEVFSLNGENLNKQGLAAYRTRLKLNVPDHPQALFIKRYQNPPLRVQIKNWLNHRKIQSLAASDVMPAFELTEKGIRTYDVIAFGSRFSIIEKRSFAVIEEIPNAGSLEKKLPEFTNLRDKISFIEKLAAFVKKFHNTGYRHRDLYLCHIFYDHLNSIFYLIDLTRAFKPALLKKRFLIKDLAQLFYSAPASAFNNQDRLRFYLNYYSIERLTSRDKIRIRGILKKVKKMQKHDLKKNRIPPFTA